MVTITCAGCGKTFDAKTRRARWCSDRCRKRAKRSETIAPVKEVVIEPIDGGVYDATLKALTDVDRQESALGALALRLASRLDASSEEFGSSVAALSKELRATLEAATANAQSAEEDPVDEARNRRDKRRGLRRHKD